MKRIIAIATAAVLAGCASTESGKVIEVARDAALRMAPIAADVYLKDQVAKGKITQEQADAINAAVKAAANN